MRRACGGRETALTARRAYRGVFLLMESLEIGRDRIAADARDITGGYLLEMTDPYKVKPGDDVIPSVTGQALILEDDGPGKQARSRRAWIAREVARLEAALHGPSFADPVHGWRAHLDERSAVEVLLLNELLSNEDAFRSSLFMHKPSGAPMRLGPVWDFDIAMGNADYGAARSPEGWVTAGRPWAARLMEDPGFTRALADRWRELRAGGLEERLMRTIATRARTLGPAVGRNFARWPVLGRVVWPNPVDPATGRARTTHAAELEHLRTWLRVRIAWLDAAVAELPR